MRYGYIGLGDMGSAMAGHLLSTGATVAVFDLNPAAVERAIAQGADACDSAAEVATASDVVSVCVPAAEHVEAVIAGPGGIAEARPRRGHGSDPFDGASRHDDLGAGHR